MEFNPENKVVQLCSQGMQAEAEGKTAESHNLFRQAWDIAANDFEKFTAAHYLARAQKDPDDVLAWNLKALNHAFNIADEGVKGHYPSLYLNVGKSYETLGDIPEANNNYQLAANSSDSLPPGKYSDMIRMGIAEGLKRTGTVKFSNDSLDSLVGKWCERKELRPLSLILPAYIGNLGTENDISKLISALSYLSAIRCLNEEEQGIVGGVIVKLQGVI